MRLSIIHVAAAWLTAAPPPNSQGAEFGEEGPLGLLLVLVLGIAVVFLIRSMSKHLKKVPASFDSPVRVAEDSDESSGEEGSGVDSDTSSRDTSSRDTSDSDRDQNQERDDSRA